MSFLESAGLENSMADLVVYISSRVDLPHTSLSAFCMSHNFLRIVNLRCRIRPSGVLTLGERVSSPHAYASYHELVRSRGSWKGQIDTSKVW
jgi:hypothetical protein